MLSCKFGKNYRWRSVKDFAQCGELNTITFVLSWHFNRYKYSTLLLHHFFLKFQTLPPLILLLTTFNLSGYHLSGPLPLNILPIAYFKNAVTDIKRKTFGNTELPDSNNRDFVANLQF